MEGGEGGRASPRSMEETPRCQGYMYKQGHHWHSWKRRWFVLRLSRLEYVVEIFFTNFFFLQIFFSSNIVLTVVENFLLSFFPFFLLFSLLSDTTEEGERLLIQRKKEKKLYHKELFELIELQHCKEMLENFHNHFLSN